jgi:hypothetical protein
MTRRFRDFVNRRPFCIRLREEGEAAPSMGGAPAAPPSPSSNTTDDHHFDALKMQMNIDDPDFDSALEGDVVSLYPPKEFSQSRWNMAIAGMIPAKVKVRPDGNYDVTFMLDTKKQMTPKAFFMPNQTGTKKTTYDGDDTVEKKEILSPKELQGMMTPAYRGGGQAQVGGGPGGMGGGGGGAPPMGGGGPPPGGGGAPPGGPPAI